MTEHEDAGSVCAVVVTYRPDHQALAVLLHAIAPQVGSIVIVANAATPEMQPLVRGCSAQACLLPQQENIGLAAAQNLGIAWARSQGYRYVILLDQDSEPTADMVGQLLGALLSLGRVYPVGAVGPRFHDPREHRDAPFVRVGFPINRKIWCGNAQGTVRCDFLISSGSLIPVEVLDAVGSMDAGLFIDNIDLEWSFRARAKGFALFGVCAASMHHRLGDARRTLPLGGQVVVHGPHRLYYMMRNRVCLYREPHTPRLWVAQDLPRVVVKLFLFGLLIGPRRRNLRFMLRGLWDGVLVRKGICPLD